MRVVVVWNNDHSGVLNRFGLPCPERYGLRTVENVLTALREFGHDALLCEGNKEMLAALGRFLPPGPQGRPTGMVFNMAYGIQGECRYTHVPAMLEMAGVPYTGSSPLGHALALDKVITKQLIRDAGVPTPNFCVMRHGSEYAGGLRFPVVVKPRHESTSFGLQLVRRPSQLSDAVEAIVAQYQQDALVEEYIEGREICVALLGNEELEILPLVEQALTSSPGKTKPTTPPPSRKRFVQLRLVILLRRCYGIFRWRPSAPAGAGITRASTSGSTTPGNPTCWKLTPWPRLAWEPHTCWLPKPPD